MTDLADLDGVIVHALALGYAGTETDSTDWSLFRDDLPLLTSQIGTLTVNHVGDLDYTQYTVNGVPVDPATITAVDYSGTSLVAAGWEGVARDAEGKWTSSGYSAAGHVSKEVDKAVTKYLQGGGSEEGLVKILTKHGVKNPHNYIDAVMLANSDPLTGEVKKPPLSPGQKAAATKAKQKQLADELEAKWLAKQADDAAAATPPTPPTPPPAPLAPDAGVQQALAELKAEQAAYDQAKGLSPTPTPTPTPTHAEATTTHNADVDLKVATVAGQSPPIASIDTASDAAVADYVKANTNNWATTVPAGLSPQGMRQLAKNIASQHAIDTAYLTDMGYTTQPKGAVEARRAILRETGMRKPTGGPSEPAIHQFYGESTIAAMPAAKQMALIKHHAAARWGGSPSDTLLKSMAPAALTAMAVEYDATYRTNAETLLKAGWAPEKIPHGATSSAKVLQGITTGVPAGAGPPEKAAALPAPPPGASPPPKPQGYGYGKIKTDIPKPSEYYSWSPGKKAAWTKKHALGGTSLGYAGSTSPKPKAIKVTGTPVTYPQTEPLGTHDVVTSANVAAASKVFLDVNEASKPSGAGNPSHSARVALFQSKLTTQQKTAWHAYTGSGYRAMNRCMKHGQDCSPGVTARINRMKESFVHATPAPTQLVRGKHNGPMADLHYKVGETFTEPGFGSWSTNLSTARSFAGVGGTHAPSRTVITHLVNSHQVPSVPGTVGEGETIMPAGTQYRVLRIHDSVTATGVQQRTLWVEVVGSMSHQGA